MNHIHKGLFCNNYLKKKIVLNSYLRQILIVCLSCDFYQYYEYFIKAYFMKIRPNKHLSFWYCWMQNQPSYLKECSHGWYFTKQNILLRHWNCTETRIYEDLLASTLLVNLAELSSINVIYNFNHIWWRWKVKVSKTPEFIFFKTFWVSIH